MWKFIFKSSKLPPSYGTTCICAIMGEKKAHRWWPKFRSDGHLHNLSPSPSLHGPNAVGCLLVTLLECNYVIFRIQINHSRMPTTVVMLSSTCVCVCTCTRAECADDKTRPGWHPSVGSFFLVTSTITPRHCSGGHIPRGTKCENVRVHLSTWKWQTFVQPAPLKHVECGWEKGGGGWREGGFVKATSVDLDPLCDVKCIRFVSKVVKVLKWWCASAARCHYRRESAAAMQFSTVVGSKLAGRIAFTLERVFRRDHFPCSGFYYYWRDYFLIECICTLNWLLLTFKSA